MASGYPMRWNASEEEDDNSGTAIFVIDDTKYEMELDTFAHCQTIDKMLGEVFDQGKEFGANKMMNRFKAVVSDGLDDI